MTSISPSFATLPGTAPVRLVLVGAGGMGREWARTIAAEPLVRLVAWVDVLPQKVGEGIVELSLEGVLAAGSVNEALEKVEADAVVDVTVPQAHHDITVHALARGLPVLGEKPLADTMDEARSMVRAADEAGQLFMVSQSRRYDDHLRTFRTAVEQVAPVGILTAQFFLGPRFGGFRDTMDDPLLLDMAIHAFDTARYLGTTDGAEPVSLWCDAFNPSWSWYAGNAAAVVSVAMSDGSRFVYTGVWCADGRPTSWNAEWRAVGARGTASWDGEAQVSMHLAGEETQRAVPIEDRGPVGIAGALQDFVAALRTGRTPMGECHDNLRSLAMVHAAVQSAREGRQLSLGTADAVGTP